MWGAGGWRRGRRKLESSPGQGSGVNVAKARPQCPGCKRSRPKACPSSDVHAHECRPLVLRCPSTSGRLPRVSWLPHHARQLGAAGGEGRVVQEEHALLTPCPSWTAWPFPAAGPSPQAPHGSRPWPSWVSSAKPCTPLGLHAIYLAPCDERQLSWSGRPEAGHPCGEGSVSGWAVLS